MGLISLSKVTLGYGGRVLLDAADLSVERGDRMSLIGRNGCGKTTLLKIMAGILRPDSGLVERAKNLSAAYLPQEVPTGLRGSVYAVIAGGLGAAVPTERSPGKAFRRRGPPTRKSSRPPTGWNSTRRSTSPRPRRGSSDARCSGRGSYLTRICFCSTSPQTTST